MVPPINHFIFSRLLGFPTFFTSQISVWRSNADSEILKMSPPLNITEAILDPVVSEFPASIPYPMLSFK